MPDDPIGIYIHVPYCRVACPYCDFVKRPVSGGAPDAFTDALRREIREFEGPSRVRSVFFGGGTPSLLTPAAMEAIFDALRARFDFNGGRQDRRVTAARAHRVSAEAVASSPAGTTREFPKAGNSVGLSAPVREAVDVEIALEANPDDITPELLRHWRELGINRLSLGVQSFDEEVLRFLGRCHDAAIARQACKWVAVHFENWGMDLIFGAKPILTWDATLEECLRFDPPHVSTYGLTYEQRTPFWNLRHTAIADDESLALYRRGMEALSDYDHYEVSNFAKPGFQSVHNQIYWRNESYAGFGPGAVSYIGNVRSRNLSRVAGYLARPREKEESEVLDPREERVETLIQHFRTRAGIKRAAYRSRFGNEIEKDFGDVLGRLTDRGLLAVDGGRYHLTRKGYELNDEIGLELV